MGKSLVERYEQILSQDPSSSVFVELARALLERGDSAQAMKICEEGLAFHPRSVVARVLWGKSLINLSRPAEAMEQFDQAIAIDRDNPHAYNLIGEVLLRKGLYRSALPLLKRAVVLQPDDGRVRQWLEQTEHALTGGPAPTLGAELDTVLESALTPSGSIPAVKMPEPPAARVSANTGDAQPTELHQAYVPSGESNASAGSDRTGFQTTGFHPTGFPTTDAEMRAAADASPAPDPSTTLTTEGMPQVLLDPKQLADLKKNANPSSEGAIKSARPKSSGSDDEPTATDASPLIEGLIDGSPLADSPSDDELRAAGLPDRPTFTPIPLALPEPMPGLLADIPVPAASSSLVEMPKVEVSSQAALAIAQEYERELREKLRATEEEAAQTFWARHWLKVSIAAVLLVALAIGGWAFQQVRSKNNNRTLDDELVHARKALLIDTREGFAEALRTLDHALDMDASSVEAQALIAYTHARIFAELGHGPEDRDQASLGLARAGVREKFPGLSLVTDYQVANEEAQPGLRKQVLSSSLDEPEVQTLAGELLLAQGNFKGAIDKLKKALESQPSEVRAWILLAEYNRTHDDCVSALNIYTGGGIPAKMAPDHPERVIGAAECRLVLSREVEISRAELEKLSPEGLLPEQRVRRALALARAYGQSSEPAKAVALLTEEGKLAPERNFDFQLALGDALRRAGDWEGAQRAADAALKSKPSSDEAKELVGRLLIGRDRERDVLARFPDDEGRRIRLVRAKALVKLGDWKRARAELQKTQVGGKFSTEAVVYLAMIDAAEGQVERAQAVLERVLGSTKRARGEVQVALGGLYWQRGLLDKARAQFEEAAKDPDDYEGACSLGRLLLALGLPDAAVEPLTLAIARDGFHGEARSALARAYLELGKNDEALAQLETWQKDNPSSPVLKRDLAFTYLQLGPARYREADSASAWALKLAPKDVAVYRIRAQYLFARGDVKGAFAALEKANKLNPKDAETFCAIGQAFLSRGNFVNAQKAFDAAHRESPALACSRLGSLLLKPVAARGVLADLKGLADTTHPIWERSLAEATRTRVLLTAGNLKDARAAADEAVKLGPFSAEAQLANALVSMRLREDEKARAAFEKATQLQPGDARIHLAYADAMSHSGSEAARAVSEYQLFLRLEDHSADAARVKKILPALKKQKGVR